MSNFVVSARKYRPQEFGEVVGQEHVTQTLKNALRTDHLAHAFLFCGPRGVGKTTCARILAKTINCEHPTEQYEPCGKCDSCLSFEKNASFNITELDAASNNSVEHIRALIEQVRFQPQQGKYKVFIIDEVHMLSSQAFNAFLKTLEEPPPYAIFILATTEKHKILPTILSRCQVFDFRRIQVPRMVQHLQGICATEQIEAEEEALHIIAQKADGALRDALSIFDRIVSYSGNHITYEDVIQSLNVLDYDYYFQLLDAFLTENRAQVMRLFDQIVNNGFEPDIFLIGLAEHLRNILVCQDEATLSLLEVSESLRTRYQQQAQLTPASFLLTALNIISECDVHYKMARNKRLHVEMALLKMTYLHRQLQAPSAPVIASTPEKKNHLAKLPKPASTTPSEQKEEKENVEKEVTDASSINENITATTPTYNKVEEPMIATAPAPAKSKLRGSTKHNMIQIQPMNHIMQEVAKEAEVSTEVQKLPLTLEKATETWQQYIKDSTSGRVQSILNSVELAIENESVIAKVSSPLSASIVREEKALHDQLRAIFQNPSLPIVPQVEEQAAKQQAAKLTKKKKWTPREKYSKMMEINPLVKEFIECLDLKLDEH